MMLFDFFKKLFGWADERGRKRRADDSSSLHEEFVNAKRHRGDNNMGNRLSVFTTSRYSSEPEDDVKILNESLCQSTNAKRLMNETKNVKDKSFCCKKSPTNMNSHNLAENSNPNISGNAFTNGRYSTINKTHRLREKKQYGEMLQHFVPHRIQILDSKVNEARIPRRTPEVIDLEKYEPKQSSSNSLNNRRYLLPSSCQWLEEKRLKQRIAALDIKFIDRTDQTNRRKSIPTLKISKDDTPVSASSFSSKVTRKSIAPESIVSNSLRDTLASKAVMKNDYIPQTAKRYDARIEERNKEVEELKRVTELLAAQNRLAREAVLEEQLARSMRLCEAVLDDREEPEEAPLPVLTPQMLHEVKNALVPHPPNQVLVEGFGLQITRKDVHTLSGLNWLNDEVINFYMNLLIVRGGTGDNYPKVYVMNTFFYPKLLSGGHSSLKRWTRKVDIFAKELLVVPIHLGMHWCMSVVDFRDKTIKYFDSMGGSNPKCLNALRQYLHDESLDKKKQPYDTSDWKLESVKDIPQQMNGSDCGVFSCMFAEYICANKRLTFTQKDMPYFRNKMVYEILKSKLL